MLESTVCRGRPGGLSCNPCNQPYDEPWRPKANGRLSTWTLSRTLPFTLSWSLSDPWPSVAICVRPLCLGWCHLRLSRVLVAVRPGGRRRVVPILQGRVRTSSRGWLPDLRLLRHLHCVQHHGGAGGHQPPQRQQHLPHPGRRVVFGNEQLDEEASCGWEHQRLNWVRSWTTVFWANRTTQRANRKRRQTTSQRQNTPDTQQAKERKRQTPDKLSVLRFFFKMSHGSSYRRGMA